MNKIKFTSILAMACLGSAVYATPTCVLDNTKIGVKSGSLTFHCDEDVNLKTTPIYFDLTNNIPVIGVDGPGYTLFKLENDLTKVNVRKSMFNRDGYVLSANKSYTLSFDVFNFFMKNYEVKDFRVGEQSKLKGVVSIKLPPKPNFIHSTEKPTIELYKNGAKVTEVTDTDWNGIKTIDLDVGSSADIKILVRKIGGSAGFSEPDEFTLTPGYTQKVRIGFEAPASITGSVNIITETPDTTSVSPKYRLKNSEGKIVSEGNLNFYNQIHINNLPASSEGVSYTLEVDSFVDNGYEYTPKYTRTIVVKGSESTNVNVSFDKEALPVPAEKVSFEVSGLPAGKTTTLKLMSNEHSEELTLDGNGTYEVEIPQDGQLYRIVASELDGYDVSIEPNNVLVADKDSQTYNVIYTEKAVEKFNLGLVSYDTRPKYGKIMFVGKPNVDRQEITVNVDDPDNNNCKVYRFKGYDNTGRDTWSIMGRGNGEYKFIPEEVIWNGGNTLISYDCVGVSDFKKDVTVRFDVTVDGVTKSISEDVVYK